MYTSRLYIINLVMRLLPPTRCWAIKRMLLRWAGAAIGENVRIVSSVRIHLSGKLTIGTDTFIGHEVMIVGGNAPINIGARVDIAPRVLIASGSHLTGVASGRAAGDGVSYPINIGAGTWVGAGSIVLGGVNIGTQCIVGAGSLVRRDVPDCMLAAGVPARVVRCLIESIK